MRFQVPQFIEVEDKVFGPFTFKQFIYIAGGTGICFILLRILPKFFAIIAIIPVATLSLGLAFYRVNDRPFIQIVESFFKYAIGSRLYLWRRKDDKPDATRPMTAEDYQRMQLPTISEGKLKEMTWKLDVKRENGGE